MRRGERVRLPDSIGRHSARSDASRERTFVHRRDLRRDTCASTLLDSTRRPREEFVGSPRGQQGQAVRRGRRGRVRPRHRPGVQGHRPRGQPARASAPARRRARCSRPASVLGPAREQALRDAVPQLPRQGGARARRRPDRHAGDRDHRRPRSGPGRVRRHVRGAPEITVARLRRARGSSCRRSRRTDDDLDRGRTQPSCAGTARSSTSTGPSQTGDYVTLDLAATRDGEEVLGLNTEDWSYEVGKGWVTEDFDEQLIGASAGDELTFTSTRRAPRARPTSPSRSQPVQELELPRTRPTNGSARTSASSTPSRSGTRRFASAWRTASSTRPASELIEAVTTGALGRAGRDRAARSRWSTPTCNQRVQDTVAAVPVAGHRHRSSGCRPPGRTPQRSSRSLRGRSARPSRSTSPCAPSPRPRDSTSTTTTSTPSTPAWPCSVGQKAKRRPQGLRAERRRPRADRPDPQVEGARLAAPPRRDRRPRRQRDRPRRSCSATTHDATTIDDHDHDTTTTTTTHDHDHARITITITTTTTTDHDHDDTETATS